MPTLLTGGSWAQPIFVSSEKSPTRPTYFVLAVLIDLKLISIILGKDLSSFLKRKKALDYEMMDKLFSTFIDV